MTTVVDTRRLGPDDIADAAEVLRRGGTLGLPTETVYGLAADASFDRAVAAIFTAKGRPAGHPLIVHLGRPEELGDWARPVDERAEALAAAFWPGPLTMVLPTTGRAVDAVVGGRSTVGLRIPSHPVGLAVIRAFGGGVAAPSANRFGHVSPTTADHVLADLGGRIDAVIDGGPTTVGVESTIVELIDDRCRLLRPGGVAVSRIEAVLGEEIVDDRGGESRAAGMLRSHYAPRASVEIVAAVDPDRLADGVAVVGPVDVDHDATVVLPDHAEGYAAGLYAALRSVDRPEIHTILVVPPRHGDLLDAVLDRMAKASS